MHLNEEVRCMERSSRKHRQNIFSFPMHFKKKSDLICHSYKIILLVMWYKLTRHSKSDFPIASTKFVLFISPGHCYSKWLLGCFWGLLGGFLLQAKSTQLHVSDIVVFINIFIFSVFQQFCAFVFFIFYFIFILFLFTVAFFQLEF